MERDLLQHGLVGCQRRGAVEHQGIERGVPLEADAVDGAASRTVDGEQVAGDRAVRDRYRGERELAVVGIADAGERRQNDRGPVLGVGGGRRDREGRGVVDRRDVNQGMRGGAVVGVRR